MLEEAKEAAQNGLFDGEDRPATKDGLPLASSLSSAAAKAKERLRGEDGGGAPTRPAAEAASCDSCGISEVRWLMHWIRGRLSCHFASLRQVSGECGRRADGKGEDGFGLKLALCPYDFVMITKGSNSSDEGSFPFLLLPNRYWATNRVANRAWWLHNR